MSRKSITSKKTQKLQKSRFEDIRDDAFAFLRKKSLLSFDRSAEGKTSNEIAKELNVKVDYLREILSELLTKTYNWDGNSYKLYRLNKKYYVLRFETEDDFSPKKLYVNNVREVYDDISASKLFKVSPDFVSKKITDTVVFFPCHKTYLSALSNILIKLLNTDIYHEIISTDKGIYIILNQEYASEELTTSLMKLYFKLSYLTF